MSGPVMAWRAASWLVLAAMLPVWATLASVVAAIIRADRGDLHVFWPASPEHWRASILALVIALGLSVPLGVLSPAERVMAGTQRETGGAIRGQVAERALRIVLLSGMLAGSGVLSLVWRAISALDAAERLAPARPVTRDSIAPVPVDGSRLAARRAVMDDES
jgi:hypothetical protein